MKKITAFTILFLTVSLIADFEEIKNSAKLTFADQKPLTVKDCNKVMNTVYENMKKDNLENAEEIEKKREMIFPALMRECESRKYNLECLMNAKSIAEISQCKK